jgi:hypothetical protein
LQPNRTNEKNEDIISANFPKAAKHRSVFTDALSEAFLDFFKEMGYKMNSKK